MRCIEAKKQGLKGTEIIIGKQRQRANNNRIAAPDLGMPQINATNNQVNAVIMTILNNGYYPIKLVNSKHYQRIIQMQVNCQDLNRRSA